MRNRTVKRLTTACFCALLPVCLAWPTSMKAQKIAFTFDDLPAHSTLPPGQTRVEIGTKILQALKDAHLPPVYGFVNGIRTVEEPKSTPVLDAWRAAGFPLGNHSWSHMNLDTHTLVEFEADVLRNEPLLESRMGNADWHWFRFPNLNEGNTPEKRAGVRVFLQRHDYKIAGVTMSFGDYMWNAPYARCVAKKDTKAIGLLESSYLQAAKESIPYFRGLSKQLYGCDIPYVLLMHLGALDAKMLPRLLALYRAEGFQFIPLEEAEKDPFYEEDTDLSLPPGPDDLEQAMAAQHLPVPPRPKPPIALDSLCR